MNNEQKNNVERFRLVELSNGGFALCDREAPANADVACIFWPKVHPYARKAAEDERDRLNAWNQEGGTIRPVEYLPTPRPVPHVGGTFSEAASPTLTIAEKRRYLAEVFRSPEFTDCDKFSALKEDNRMIAMFSLEKGKEEE